MRRCRHCRQRDALTVRRALVRKRGLVVSLIAAAFLTLVTGLWASGVTGDVRLGAAGVGLALGVLFFANEAEGS